MNKRQLIEAVDLALAIYTRGELLRRVLLRMTYSPGRMPGPTDPIQHHVEYIAAAVSAEEDACARGQHQGWVCLSSNACMIRRTLSMYHPSRVMRWYYRYAPILSTSGGLLLFVGVVGAGVAGLLRVW